MPATLKECSENSVTTASALNDNSQAEQPARLVLERLEWPYVS